MKRALLFIVYGLLLLSGYAQQTDWEPNQTNCWVRQMAMDGDDLWLATNAGLVKYNKQTGEHTVYTSSDSGLCSDNLLSVACRNGKVVTGSYDNGVSEFDGITFTNYNMSNTPFETNQAFEEVIYDSDGNLWLGGSEYLYKYDGTAWEKYTLPHAGMSAWLSFNALKFSADGTLWFGTQGPIWDGSFGYVTKEKEIKTVSSDQYYIQEIDIDKQGNIWFCSDKGIYCYDGNIMKCFNSTNSPLPETIWTYGLSIDADNNVWFGCDNLLFKYDGAEFTSYQVPTDAPVRDLLIDGKAIWVATAFDKLFRFEDGQFESIDFTTNTQKTEEDDDYRPFVEEGKVWKVGNTQTILDNSVQVVDYYYFAGDTIINGKTCKQMMCQRFVNPNHPYYEYFPKSPSKVGAWYEENKKIYFYDETRQSTRIMYDFSLNANDTLLFLTDWSSPFIIGPKQTGGIDGFKGVYRDIRMCGEEGQSYHDTFWLEGVGCIRGPISNPCDPILGDPKPEFLMSCTVGDEIIYLNDEVEDGASPEGTGARKKRFDFTHTIKIQPKARKRSEELSLYGEYNDLQLGINLDPLDDAYQVRITDESGKAVYEKSVNAGSIVGLNIDISAYAEGRYTVTVENSQESFTGQFETQTTGIEAIRNNKEEKGIHIYNLQGQRLNSLQKGLNIVNGRKIYVR